MKRIQLKHPRPVVWLHWLNFPLLAVLAWSGLMIYWANDVYLPIPQRFYALLGLDYSLARGMAFHFCAGLLFALNGSIYVSYLFWSGEWRPLAPDRRSFADAVRVTLHDLGLLEAAPPQGKYNAAQRLAYTATVAMGAGSVLTGLAIYKPLQLSTLAALLGGYEAARVEHFALLLAFAVFFVVHVVQVARAGWGNLRSMVAGVELVDEGAP